MLFAHLDRRCGHFLPGIEPLKSGFGHAQRRIEMVAPDRRHDLLAALKALERDRHRGFRQGPHRCRCVLPAREGISDPLAELGRVGVILLVPPGRDVAQDGQRGIIGG
jgi:hypothetical protein